MARLGLRGRSLLEIPDHRVAGNRNLRRVWPTASDPSSLDDHLGIPWFAAVSGYPLLLSADTCDQVTDVLGTSDIGAFTLIDALVQ